MNSKTALPAIMLNLRKKRKSKDDPRPTLTFDQAASEIAQALKIEHEAAAMMLYGLCATGNVGCVNDQGEIIDYDECTIAAFSGASIRASVVAGDVRPYLTKWSTGPLPHQRAAVIQAMLPRTISWKEFCNQVRDKCNGWIKTGGEPKPQQGFSQKQIQRIVKDLMAK